MKKNVYLIAMLLINIILCAGCTEKNPPNVTNSSSPAITSHQDNTGGLSISINKLKFNQKYYSIPACISDIVEKSKLDTWKINSSGKRNYDETTIINFIQDFGITKEQFINANNSWGENKPFTELEIDVLFSSNPKKINSVFVNTETALYNPSDGEIYDIKSLSQMTKQDISNKNIPESELERLLENSKNQPILAEYESLLHNLIK